MQSARGPNAANALARRIDRGLSRRLIRRLAIRGMTACAGRADLVCRLHDGLVVADLGGRSECVRRLGKLINVEVDCHTYFDENVRYDVEPLSRMDTSVSVVKLLTPVVIPWLTPLSALLSAAPAGEPAGKNAAMPL